MRTGGRPDDDLADIDILRLADGIEDRMGDCLGADRHRPESRHGLARGRVGDRVGQFRCRRAGRDDGDADAIGLLPQPVGDGADGEFRRAIDGCGRRDAVTADRRQVDDLPGSLRLHDRQGCRDAVEHTLDVDIDHPVPLLDLEGRERRERHDAGIVEDDVEPAEFRSGKTREGLDLGTVGDVKLPQTHRSAPGFDFAGEPLQAFGTPRADHDVGAGRSQHLCRSFADAAAGAGDGNDFSFDIGHFRLRLSVECFLGRGSVGEIGAERCLRPGVEICPQRVEPSAGDLQGGRAEQQAQGRLLRLECRDDGSGGARGIARLPAGDRTGGLAPLARRFGIVIDNSLGFDHRPAGPVSTEGTGFENRHLDAERIDLMEQRFRQGFDRKLRGVVVAGGGEGDEPAERRDVEDMPPPA
ncbi:hypothetical protein RHECNPAF_2530040 [Rhizobium etli CNPAF512]|nr:hypothetical protein RHECNPAF_2530040 [Rhizobium etli CNPAF512]